MGDRRWSHGNIDFTFNTSHLHQICQIVSTMLCNALQCHKTAYNVQRRSHKIRVDGGVVRVRVSAS